MIDHLVDWWTTKEGISQLRIHTHTDTHTAHTHAHRAGKEMQLYTTYIGVHSRNGCPRALRKVRRWIALFQYKKFILFVRLLLFLLLAIFPPSPAKLGGAQRSWVVGNGAGNGPRPPSPAAAAPPCPPVGALAPCEGGV